MLSFTASYRFRFFQSVLEQGQVIVSLMAVTLAYHGSLALVDLPVFRVTAEADPLDPASLLAKTEIRYRVPHRREEMTQELNTVLQLSWEEPLKAITV